MARIKVETPDGIKEIEIQGDTPTPAETAAIKKQFFSKPKTQKVKDPTNPLGAFAAGFDDPTGLKGLKDKLGKKWDTAKNAYQDGEKLEKNKSSSDGSSNDSKTRSGLQFMKQELGFDNPQLIITGLNKIQNGRTPSKNELAELAPVLQAVRTALEDPQGRNKLRALLKSIR